MNNTGKDNNGLAHRHLQNEENYTPGTIVIINCVLNAPLMFISIIGNTLVLAAIVRTSSIRSTSMIMLCSLAISDLLVGFLSQPLYIAFQLTKNRFVEPVWRMIGPSLCGVSLLTITAITVDRYLALHYHMRYATLVTESRVKYTLLIIWLAVLPLSAFVLMNIRVHVILSGVSTIICLIICTISYIGIYRIALRHQLQIRAQQQAMQIDSAANNLNIVRLKRSAVNTLAFYLALIACYFPMYVILTLSGISKKDWQTEWNFATTLVYCNSAINPFLYCWRLRELRTAVIKTAKQMLCIQTEEN